MTAPAQIAPGRFTPAQDTIGSRSTPTINPQQTAVPLRSSPPGRFAPQIRRFAQTLGLARLPLTAAAPSPIENQKSNIENLSGPLARILRPQAAYRWLLPQISAITPQYIEMALRGALAGNHLQMWELFDLMEDSWPELLACENEFKFGVQRKKVIFEPFHEEDEEPTPLALEKLKLVSTALRRMRPDPVADENTISGIQFDILDAWFKCFSVQEVDWQMLPTASGPVIAPRSTFWVHPVCYAWDMDGRLGLRVELNTIRDATAKNLQNQRNRSNPWNISTYQPTPQAIDEFPPNKFLIAIHKAKSGTALGGALLRPLAWWWCAANFSADWLMNLAQIFGLPLRWANYQSGAPQATVDAICNMLQNMGSASWAAFPEGTSVNFMEAGKTGESSPQGDLLDRANAQARLLILGQTMSASGRGNMNRGGGGMAFGQVESDVKSDRIEAGGDFTCEIFNQQIIPMICRLNYGEDGEDEAPTMRLIEDQEGGPEAATRDTTLAAGGLKIGANFLYKKYGIPKPEADEETIGGAPEPDPAPQSKPGQSKDPVDAKSTGSPHTDSLITSSLHPLARAAASDLQPIRQRLAAILQIDDPEIARSRLTEFLASLDKLKADLQQDPALAHAIADTISAAVANGLAQKRTRP